MAKSTATLAPLKSYFFTCACALGLEEQEIVPFDTPKSARKPGMRSVTAPQTILTPPQPPAKLTVRR